MKAEGCRGFGNSTVRITWANSGGPCHGSGDTDIIDTAHDIARSAGSPGEPKSAVTIAARFAALFAVAAILLAAQPGRGQRPRLFPRGLPTTAARGNDRRGGKPVRRRQADRFASARGRRPRRRRATTSRSRRKMAARFIPPMAKRPVRGLLREMLARPQSRNGLLSFQGDAPLDLTLYAPTAIERQSGPASRCQVCTPACLPNGGETTRRNRGRSPTCSAKSRRFHCEPATATNIPTSSMAT